MKMAGGERALQGLRGLSALHLLLYHSLSRTKWPQGWLVDLQVQTLPQICLNQTFLLWFSVRLSFHSFIFQGGILMPLFFLISGFSLARSYGPRSFIPESKSDPHQQRLSLKFRGCFSYPELQDWQMISSQICGHCGRHQKNFPSNISTKLD